MATSSIPTPGTNNQPLNAWKDAFDRPTRQQQVEDDEFAWRRVTGIIISIISAGLVLAIVSVLLSG